MIILCQTLTKEETRDIRFTFCDISKAFDMMWQMALIFKLKNLGFGVNILGWIDDYLNDRQQGVN